MGNVDEHTLLLGELNGKMDLVIQNQQAQNDKMDGLDARLRKVETKAAMNGAVAGSVAGIGVAIIAAKVKAIFGIS